MVTKIPASKKINLLCLRVNLSEKILNQYIGAILFVMAIRELHFIIVGVEIRVGSFAHLSVCFLGLGPTSGCFKSLSMAFQSRSLNTSDRSKKSLEALSSFFRVAYSYSYPLVNVLKILIEHLRRDIRFTDLDDG